MVLAKNAAQAKAFYQRFVRDFLYKLPGRPPSAIAPVEFSRRKGLDDFRDESGALTVQGYQPLAFDIFQGAGPPVSPAGSLNRSARLFLDS